MGNLCVYSSNRALMHSLEHDTLLGSQILIGEFFEQVLLVDGYRKLPAAKKLPLMLSLIDKCSEELESANLLFERSFLGYLESSDFLFRFFNELAHAGVDIHSIPLADTYGEYEDHLRVLSTLLHRYKERLEELHYYDGVIFPPNAIWHINETYVCHFDEIEFYLDGLLTPFHQNILSKVSALTPVKVHFSMDCFNEELPILPTPLMDGCKRFHAYSIDYQSGEKLAEQKQSFPKLVRAYSFRLQISQAALIFAKIDEWIELGVCEEDIVIIVPNEGFCAYLDLLDSAHNLNFAMGRDISLTHAYQKLQARLEELYQKGDVDSKLLDFKTLGERVIALLEGKDAESRRVRECVSELLFMWEDMEIQSEISLLELLLEELKNMRLDDIRGGKIRVMGVLETRGVSFKRVVIVDCNEGIVPSVQENDLFLNTALRKRLSMPTIFDSQRLQKHYYYAIMQNAQEVALSYVTNEDSHPSLLLDEISNIVEIEYLDGDSLYALLPQAHKNDYKEDCFVGTMPRTLTPSKLKTFLTCPRQYFFRHIENLNDIGQDNAYLGKIAHGCLESVFMPYVGSEVSFVAQELKKILKESLNKQLYEAERENGINFKLRAEFEILSHELQRLCDVEEEICLGGVHKVEILCLEGENMRVEWGGFEFYVRPDRIQKVREDNQEWLEVIDYKYRNGFKIESVANTCDFACVLYVEAVRNYYPQYAHLPIEFWYWNIKAGRREQDMFVGERGVEPAEKKTKAEVLSEVLRNMQGELEFTKSQKYQACGYCEYRQLCDRD